MSNIFPVRQFGTTITLPYSFADVQLKINELATADNFSACIDKLSYNLAYMQSQTQYGTYTTSYSANMFPVSAIEVSTSEYIDSFVVNKALYKLLVNHFLFRNNLHSLFTTVSTASGYVLTGTRYIIESDPTVFDYQITLDNFVGVNEIVSTSVINRTLSEIYTLQTRLLELIQEVQA